MQAVPIVLSAATQTTVRQPPLKSDLPVTAIAMAGSQNKPKASHGVEKMSRELLDVGPRSMRLTPYMRSGFILQSGVQARVNPDCGWVTGRPEVESAGLGGVSNDLAGRNGMLSLAGNACVRSE